MTEDERGDLIRRGATTLIPDGDLLRLYEQAWHEFGAMCLWNVHRRNPDAVADAIIVARSLRREGDMRAWNLATLIEEGCRNAIGPATQGVCVDRSEP